MADSHRALGPGHDRSGFSWGPRRWTAISGSSDAGHAAAVRRLAMWRGGHGSKIAGYYTLAAGGVPLAELPAALAKEAASLPVGPGRAARPAGGGPDVPWAKAGKPPCCGTRSERSLRSEIGVFALIVDAKDKPGRGVLSSTTASSHSAVSRTTRAAAHETTDTGVGVIAWLVALVQPAGFLIKATGPPGETRIGRIAFTTDPSLARARRGHLLQPDPVEDPPLSRGPLVEVFPLAPRPSLLAAKASARGVGGHGSVSGS